MKADSIIIVDVESTCWEKSRPPSGEQSEIIEIGICSLIRETGEIQKARSLLVKPQRSRVSPFCIGLTTLTQEQVSQGMLFHDACAFIQAEYETHHYPWGSWGNYDRNMFIQQCASFHVEYPFSEKHYNVKKLFAERYALGRQVGMAQGLQIAGLALQGIHHRGGDDAMNIARLLRHLLEKFGQNVLRDSQ
ncbi:MAG: exonuclease domain-containing protein [Anaerolineae bacterium]|nr:exonuclease domain-containing protein [Anaerolineae bacterium]